MAQGALEAGRWEHVISDEVEVRLVELLGNPTTCPHGNPIPGAVGGESPSPQISLADVELGETVRLERITEEVELDMASLVYLDEHGLVPGRSALVRTRAADGTLTLDVDGTSVDIDANLTHQLFVAVA